MSASPPIVEPPHMIGELRELKLPAVAQHWQRLALGASRKRQAHGEYLADLIHLEVTQRRERGIARRVGEARFHRVRPETVKRT